MDPSNQSQNQQVPISEVSITNQNKASQMIIHFMNVSQKRWIYSIYESIKIYAIATIVNPLTIISYILFVEMNVSFLNNLEYLRIFKEQIVKD